MSNCHICLPQNVHTPGHLKTCSQSHKSVFPFQLLATSNSAPGHLSARGFANNIIDVNALVIQVVHIDDFVCSNNVGQGKLPKLELTVHKDTTFTPAMRTLVYKLPREGAKWYLQLLDIFQRLLVFTGYRGSAKFVFSNLRIWSQFAAKKFEHPVEHQRRKKLLGRHFDQPYTDPRNPRIALMCQAKSNNS